MRRDRVWLSKNSPRLYDPVILSYLSRGDHDGALACFKRMCVEHREPMGLLDLFQVRVLVFIF